jgi:hypothetical protein
LPFDDEIAHKMGVTMEEEIRKYARKLGADALGFASLENYRSPQSPDLKTILPKASPQKPSQESP